jgi:hypothetical protein
MRLHRDVALKALPGEFTGDAERRERLKREARAAASLNHPGIATVYALEEFDDHLFIASEFLEGETLRDEVERSPLAPDGLLETAAGIAEALSAAHQRGIVHRDLKPENLIRLPNGHVKILDFGAARFRDASGVVKLTAEGAALGTPAYMSPEQIRGEPVDGRSDLFAFGIVLYELAGGVHPFAGADSPSTLARILEREPDRLTTSAHLTGSADTSLAALRDIIAICLRKNPDERYQTAEDLATALRAAAKGSPPPPRVADTDAGAAVVQGEHPRWWWKFHQVAAAAGYGLLLLLLSQTYVQTGSLLGLSLLLAGVVSAITATAVRLHLLFVIRWYPREWSRQRAHTRLWLRLADGTFAAILVSAGLAFVTSDAMLGLSLVAAAAAVLVAFAVVEPATTRAAFDDPPA